MSLLSIASEKSRRRGYEYFTQGRVTSAKGTGPTVFAGTVRGSGAAEYHVSIDLEHPRRSSCDCPFAAGNSRVCKHMIALYFTVFPDESEKYRVELERRLAEIELSEKLAEELELKRAEAVNEYLSRMSKEELISLVSSLLQRLPEWQYDSFIDELTDNAGEDDWEYAGADDGEDDWEYEGFDIVF